MKNFLFLIFPLLLLLLFTSDYGVVETSASSETTAEHAKEDHYEFPLSLGKQVSVASGRCSVGDQVYPNCFIKVHSFGISIHVADKVLSNIPLIAFQGDNVLFPEPTTESLITIRNNNIGHDADKVHIRGLYVRDISVPISNALLDQLTTGTLRLSANVQVADLDISKIEYDKLKKLCQKS